MSIAVPQPPYPKAPITEAVIHLAVSNPATSEELRKLVARFAKEYPQEETLANISVGLDPTGGPPAVMQHPVGYRLRSIEQTDFMLVLPDGIAAARLTPYPGWEHLRERARQGWSEWRRNVNHSPPKRIGIRYINRIDVPIKEGGFFDIDAYLKFAPRVPDFSKHPLNGFLVQATKPTDLEHWSVAIASTIVSPQPLIDFLSLSLDIDVFRTELIPGREADLWDCVEAARELKDDVFESCITDEARKLFA
jgi:uncharacterized protein (TIGR04255 family)